MIIKTTGDKITDVALSRIGDKGLFVKEIEQALLDGEVDVAIHSMEDMPTELPDGLTVGCVPERKPAFDALITPTPQTLDTLSHGALIGTGSLRRRAQLAAARPDLQFAELRGNLPTRLARLAEGRFAATLLGGGRPDAPRRAGRRRLPRMHSDAATVRPGGRTGRALPGAAHR